MTMRVRETGVFYVRSEALTLVTMKITVFWDVTPSILGNTYRKF
jgi:hypothetical protein